MLVYLISSWYIHILANSKEYDSKGNIPVEYYRFVYRSILEVEGQYGTACRQSNTRNTVFFLNGSKRMDTYEENMDTI